jgi:hypothetical protein
MTEHHDPHHHTAHTPQELDQVLHEHDEWFRHAPDEPTHQQSHGDFNPYTVLGVLGATIVGVILVVIVTLGWFERLVADKRHRVQEANPDYSFRLTERTTAWKTQLHAEPSWVDEKTNTIRIPIDRAIETVVKEYATAQ